MARQKASGVFVVTPFQFEEDQTVQGIAFSTATAASQFATKSLAFQRKLAAKLKGVDAKTFTGAIGMDVLMQPTDEKGNPTGNAALFEVFGVDENALDGTDTDDEDED